GDDFCHPRHQSGTRRRLPGAVSRAARTCAGFGGRSHAHRGALGALRRKCQGIKCRWKEYCRLMDFQTFLDDTGYLLSVDFVQQALIACALLGVLSGVMTSLVVLRQMSFSVHATSELALMGAAAALLFGLNIGWGAIAGAIGAAIVLAVLGFRGQQ